MKYVRVEITKSLGSNGRVDWVYPDGYSADGIIPARYQHQSGQVQHYEDEFMLGIADDSVTANGTTIIELTKAEYDAELLTIPLMESAQQ